LAHHELLAQHVGEAERLIRECPEQQRGFEWHYLQRLCHTDLLTCSGHASEVRALAYSPDGKWLASGCGKWIQGQDYGELRVWDAQTGRELHTLLRDHSSVFALAFSPDGQLLASGARDRKVVLWNPQTGKRVRELIGHQSAIHSLAFSPNGKRLASGGADHIVRIWDVDSGTCLHVLKQHPGAIWSLAWSPDGRHLVSGDWDGHVNLWNPDKGRHLRLLSDLVDIRVLTFSPDNAWLVAGSYDGTIWLWDFNKLDVPPVPRHPNSGPIYDLEISPDGRRLAYCSLRGGARICELRTGAELHAFPGHNGVPMTLAVSPDGRRLATGGVDGTVKVWDATIRESTGRNFGLNANLLGAEYGDDGIPQALGYVGRDVKAWDAKTGRVVVSVPNQATPLTAIASSPDRRRLAWFAGDKTLWVWDVAGEHLAWSTVIDSGPVTGLAFSRDSARLAWGGTDGLVRLCNASNGEVFATLGKHSAAIVGIAFHPDGQRLTAIGCDGAFLTWELTSRKIVAQFGGSARDALARAAAPEEELSSSAVRVIRLAYSADGQRLAAVTRIRPVEIWDTTAQRVAILIDQAGDGGDCVAFSPDSRQLALGVGRVLYLWETAELDRQERLRRVEEHALAWHQSEARQCRLERNWFGRAWHLNYLVDAEPSNAAHREQRAEALAELGKWDQALADNDQAIELGSRSVIAWYNRACLALQFNDQAAYRQACAEAQEKIALTDDPDVANGLAWISLISPNAGGDPLHFVQLAEQAVQKKPGSYAYLNTLGAALYRASRFTEAISQLHSAIRAEEHKAGTGIDWAFLAMAYARAGDSENARLWLDKTQVAPELNQWQQRVELRLLRQEAEETVNGTKHAAREGNSP
jgi:WD40 repeat protein